MKIVCDNCATKYSIADEKVRGKVFKIRCKKCSHIIVVRGSGDGAGVEVAGEPSRAGESSVGDPEVGGAEPVWHLVIDREQVGPMSPDEVRQRFARGQIDVDTYIWKDGFTDWLRLSTVPDFADLAGGGARAAPAPAEERTSLTDSNDIFSNAAAGRGREEDDADLFASVPAPTQAIASTPDPGLFGGGGASSPDSRAAQPPAAASSAHGGSSSASLAGGDLFGAAPSAGLHGGGNGAGLSASAGSKMTGQRNENSVLFSLNNLTALATSSAPGKAGGGSTGYDRSSGGGEGSGLIDIKAMAASTLGAPTMGSGGLSSDDDLPAAPFAPVAAPVLMPVGAGAATPRWLIPTLAGAGGLLVVMIGVMVYLLTRPPALPPAALATNDPPAGAAASAAANGPEAAPSHAEEPPRPSGAPDAPAAAPAAAAEAHGSSRPSRREPSRPAHAREREAPPRASAAPADDAPAPARRPARPSSGGGGDELDALLNKASPGGESAPRRPAREEADDDTPEALGRTDLQKGMGSVKGDVQACGAQFGTKGVANVTVTIATSGRVTKVQVSPPFGGSPAGSCIERAVKGATFPRFRTGPMVIAYPYVLR